MKYLTVIFSVFLWSCTSKSAEEQVKNEAQSNEEFQLYKASEMAVLMEQMYVYNMQLRDKISKKENLGFEPEFFNKLSTATLTKGKEKDDFFNQKAKVFRVAQAAIYQTSNPVKSFNTMVDACIACHEVKCGGPIQRIKKLYIRGK